jgi:hypothetical protein
VSSEKAHDVTEPAPNRKRFLTGVAVGGCQMRRARRHARPGAEWYHSAVDLGTVLQGLVKYNDQPLSAQHYAESAVFATIVNRYGTTPSLYCTFFFAGAKKRYINTETVRMTETVINAIVSNRKKLTVTSK